MSSSRNGRGGLLQYNLGKELQGQEFNQTGFLNQPPPILRTAVAGLQAQYELKGHQLKESIRAVLEGNKRLKLKCAQPPSETDRLFESWFAHSDPEASCGESCDYSKLIRRPKRTDEEDDPAIHYGLIASGNRVIKDTAFRDKLAAEQDVLCFEMEAAGLINHFPCLVIRGVCDYADSHKSKEWQGWAAMVAAAYTRDLLCQINPQRVKAEPKASDVLKCYSHVLQRLDHRAQNLPITEEAELKIKTEQHGGSGTAEMPRQESYINFVHSDTISDSQLLVSRSEETGINFWNPATRAIKYILKGHSAPVYSLAFSPERQLLASGSHDQTIKLWETVTGTLMAEMEGNLGSVRSVCFSPDGWLLASAQDKIINLWSPMIGSCLCSLEDHSDLVFSVTFSPDGQLLASSSRDTTIKVWDPAASALKHTLYGHSDWVQSVAFSPDSQQLASGSSDRTIKLWNTTTGNLQCTLAGHIDSVCSVTFSPDGQLLASSSQDTTVKLWDPATGVLKHTVYGRTDWVQSVAFSLDGQLLTSGFSDLKSWERSANDDFDQTLDSHCDSVRSVAFSPDGQFLAYGFNDGTVRLWAPAAGVHNDSLHVAIINKDRGGVLKLLQESFDLVARNGLEWLWEVRQLGYTDDEIADILVQKVEESPWIYFERKAPEEQHNSDPSYHYLGCVHSETGIRSAMSDADLYSPCDQQKHLYMVEELCGLAGIVPFLTEPQTTTYGFANFSSNHEAAVVTFMGDGDHTTVLGALCEVLRRLDAVVGLLQSIRKCCDSFTIIILNQHLEVSRVSLADIKTVFVELQGIDGSRLTQTTSPEYVSILLDRLSPLCTSMGLDKVHSEIVDLIKSTQTLPALRTFAVLHLYCLTVQCLCLALLSYTKGHCGPIQPFFLDSSLTKIVLRGLGSRFHGHTLPSADASLYQLTCMSSVTRGPILAFSYFRSDDLVPDELNGNWRPDITQKLDLTVSPVDILDLWGPGHFVTDTTNADMIYAISVAGGSIYGTKTDSRILYHWNCHWPPIGCLKQAFNCHHKIQIGTSVQENTACQSSAETSKLILSLQLCELGTYPSYWDIAERQAGLQCGQYGVAQFNQTWVRFPGITKKAQLLSQASLFTTDLERPYGVQVSYCTGIARRVPLRKLVADILPAYIDGLISKPPLWTCLEQKGIFDALYGPHLKIWLESLELGEQQAFETLVLGILLMLRHTGIDPRNEYFILANVQIGLPFQSVKIPCAKENYWTKMLADSDEIATFAYLSLRCLITDTNKCASKWSNSTVLFSTSVSCETTSASSLRIFNAKAYFLGKLDSPLLAIVEKTPDLLGYCLVVTPSMIPGDYLRRLYVKRKPLRLCERRSAEQPAEDVMVSAGYDGVRGLIRALRSLERVT